ncbi:histidine kinase/DNA gyrase B/HSP90-like ATPase [Hoeflea marina]|uniref:Histidine kinase/DNA gyrase B/HSP90-like ATPase n=1 Tax=Hoeflea marina TaxID=274592 RepID=A0A317PPA9_9HYPH|nr:ATP-binding protein [Hoeflea marina]PWW00351.1 histidine kinase/DNA gyrase B/HSP90-like ATPase [Hoeflea marina]
MNDLINQPDAPRLIYGLRDTGYSFNTAAADIIDNSIAAQASEVQVRIELAEDGRKFVFFGDNGDGMSGTALFSAMRYGAPARANLASLGKFGLGLKTASSAVCLKFTVISRTGPDADFAKLAWDLEWVESQNQWEMLREPMTADEFELFDELCGEKGTLVIWSKCDRLLSKEYDDPGGAREQAAIRRLGERMIEHVALVYHRFLDTSDKRERNVAISVNGTPVNAWNPFYPEKSDQVLSPKQQQLEIELDDGTVETAYINAWILPHRRDMTKDEQKVANITNRGQGFYIYREGRVIQQGGWLGVFGVIEPHYSLLRVEFDFSHKLDEAFKVDVKKSKILFDPALEEALRTLLQPIYREAGNRYRRTERKAAVERGVDHGSANKVIGNTPATAKPSVESADPSQRTATVSNNRGSGIKLRVPVDTNVLPGTIHVDAVETITSGDLWEPAMRSDGVSGFVAGVRINKHHDFYLKIYQRAAANGYAVEGIDLLLWAFAVAENNNVNEELEPIFEDIRNEISTNLKKLLREVSLPDERELNGAEEGED